MTESHPAIGHWFRRPNGTLFEVVAIDEDDRSVEIQQFDGTIDELDLDRWPELAPVETSAPGDWSGFADTDPEDFIGWTGEGLPAGYQDPLAFLDSI